MFENVIVTGDYLALFASLDPFDYMRYGRLSDRVCVGTVRIADEWEKDEPVGLMICRETEGALVVEWLYVHLKYRERGIGSGLINSAFEESVKRGFSKLFAYVNDLECRDEVCPGERLFLEGVGMRPARAVKKNSPIFQILVPKEESGATLYAADVNEYFKAQDSVIRLEDPFFAVRSE